jgi:hypothetical protein
VIGRVRPGHETRLDVRYLFVFWFPALRLPYSYHGEGRLPSLPLLHFDLDRSISLSSLFSMFLLFFSLFYWSRVHFGRGGSVFWFTTSFGVGGPSSSQTHKQPFTSSTTQPARESSICF